MTHSGLSLLSVNPIPSPSWSGGNFGKKEGAGLGGADTDLIKCVLIDYFLPEIMKVTS